MFGVLAGLGAALSQTASYVFSRHFVTREGRSSVQLLVLAHAWMGLFSLLVLPFVIMQPVAGWGSVVLPLLGTAGCYFLGQASFFWTVRQLAASRLAPLLGLKIVFVAIIGTTIFGAALNLMQWVAVLLAAAAAVVLWQSGEKLRPSVILGICGACTGYALSDLNIPLLIAAFDPDNGIRAVIWAAVIDYIFCGLVVLPAAWRMRKLGTRDWREAIPFAVTWYLAMYLFFAAISLVGVVLAVILQSTRGVMSIGVGRWLSGTRHTAIEQSFTRGLLIRQLTAAVLMTVAIALFFIAEVA